MSGTVKMWDSNIKLKIVQYRSPRGKHFSANLPQKAMKLCFEGMFAKYRDKCLVVFILNISGRKPGVK